MEFKDLLAIAMDSQKAIVHGWAGYGTVAVILIGWLSQLKSPLKIKQKVAATIAIFFSSSFLLNTQLLNYETLAYVYREMSLLASSDLEKSMVWLVNRPSDSEMPLVYMSLVYFISLCTLIWSNRLWHGVRSA